IFPKPMGLRATGDRRLAYAVGLAVARQSRAVGFNWIHSPVLAINVNPANPEICTRAYSDRVEEVITYAEQTCRGLKEGGLIATGKHFPGRGDSACDAHYELPVITVDRETMLARELLPYRVLIEKGLLPAIMIAHSIYPAFDEEHVATVSKRILTGLLREELGFEGVITTDSMTMGAIANKYGVANACAMALEAGADLVLMKAENRLVEETFTTIRRFVAEGRIGEEELDAKVYRVLNLKYQYGLFHPWSFPSEKPEEVIADEGILTLSRTVARRSVLIARDRRGSLPLKRDQRLLLIEQATKTPNDLYWHPGTLYKYCLSYNRNVAYLETAHVHDEDDRRRIAEALPEFDTVVVTNFYRRDLLCNNETVRWLAQDPARRVIVVTNTPYELSIPVEADTVIVTFATSPRNLEVVAGVLFGQIVPEGEGPVAYRLPD
ncbi:MAG: hypothetical protein GX493_07675, partial [Firmicutes bacterium]|nr:hypothetical protein [Bacillota bacterium]